jgi:flagellar basal body-associated protein FliL
LSQDGNRISTDSSSGNLSNSNSQKTIIIIVIVISVVLLIFVLGIVYFKCIRKQNMIENESVIEEIKNEIEISSL